MGHDQHNHMLWRSRTTPSHDRSQSLARGACVEATSHLCGMYTTWPLDAHLCRLRSGAPPSAACAVWSKQQPHDATSPHTASVGRMPCGVQRAACTSAQRTSGPSPRRPRSSVTSRDAWLAPRRHHIFSLWRARATSALPCPALSISLARLPRHSAPTRTSDPRRPIPRRAHIRTHTHKHAHTHARTPMPTSASVCPSATPIRPLRRPLRAARPASPPCRQPAPRCQTAVDDGRSRNRVLVPHLLASLAASARPASALVTLRLPLHRPPEKLATASSGAPAIGARRSPSTALLPHRGRPAPRPA